MDAAKKIRLWAGLLKETRAFFDTQGFFEVTTQCLVPAGAFEASIDPLTVGDSKTAPLGQLHTSPEMEMKVLLAQSRLPIYQLTPCFRDDPHSPVHAKEFTMLEFYRIGATASAVAKDTQALLEKLAGRPLAWLHVRVDKLFRNLGLELAELPTAPDFRSAIEKLELVETAQSDSWSDLFFRVWLEKIEPAFPPDRPVLVQGYPVAVSPLSFSAQGSLFAERFEIYWRGMELCNGCTELTDPLRLRQRWEEQNQDRLARHLPLHPLPERLWLAADSGMPACAGVAVGLDRLFLALAQSFWDHRGADLIR